MLRSRRSWDQASTVAEDEAEEKAAQRWEHDARFREQFANIRSACLAYARAEARGAFKVCGGGVKRGIVAQEPQRERTHEEAVDASARYQRAAYTPAPSSKEYEEYEETEEEKKWRQAFERAEASGRVKILGQSAQGRRHVADTATAPRAAPAERAPDEPRVDVSPSGQYVLIGRHRVPFETWRERWRGNWDGMPAVREEFASFDAYVAARLAETKVMKVAS